MKNIFKKLFNKNQSISERDNQVKLEREKITNKISTTGMVGLIKNTKYENLNPIDIGATNNSVNSEEIDVDG